MPLNWVALTVFVLCFGAVTILGFAAANWRKGDLDLLHEWGLGGGTFGTLITWFLIGGDIYTAYTFIAVPAAAFGAGAIAFFAVPYTTLIYPITFVIFPRMWSVCRKHGYITAADFIRGRFGNRWLALAVAVTGLLATMPYIALQLVGLEVVIAGLGVETSGLWGDLPLIIAFVILAAFTYTSGLRAPAAIAVVKDLMIYIVIFAAIGAVYQRFGGFGAMFAAVPPEKLILPTPPANSTGAYGVYASLALGSAAALFMYPHSITAILSSASRNTIRRNSALLPAYSLVLAFLTLLGFVALVIGVKTNPAYATLFAKYSNSFAVPAMILDSFPSWFAGFAFAAIGIGALVPAAIMSIAAANLWTRNIHLEFINPRATPQQESRMAKLVSLIVKVGAIGFVVAVDKSQIINLQLLGGVWIIQTLPAVMLGLYTRWFNSWALLIGWAVGIYFGTAVVIANQFKNANYTLLLGGYQFPGYVAIYSVLANLAVAVLLTLVFNMAMRDERRDATVAADYL